MGTIWNYMRKGFAQIMAKAQEPVIRRRQTFVRNSQDDPVRTYVDTVINSQVQIATLEDMQESNGDIKIGDSFFYITTTTDVQTKDILIYNGIQYQIIGTNPTQAYIECHGRRYEHP